MKSDFSESKLYHAHKKQFQTEVNQFVTLIVIFIRPKRLRAERVKLIKIEFDSYAMNGM